MASAHSHLSRDCAHHTIQAGGGDKKKKKRRRDKGSKGGGGADEDGAGAGRRARRLRQSGGDGGSGGGDAGGGSEAELEDDEVALETEADRAFIDDEGEGEWRVWGRHERQSNRHGRTHEKRLMRGRRGQRRAGLLPTKAARAAGA
jgi:hypothetical protein